MFTVTKNHILNELKKNYRNVSVDTCNFEVEDITIKEKEEAQLQLLLACSKLHLKEQGKLIFTLKTICGFGVTEIANSLLISEDNVYKNLQRAKQKLQVLPRTYFEEKEVLTFSGGESSYIEIIIYFMFNEGYDAVNNNSSKAIHKEICFEALRLAHLLEKNSKRKVRNIFWHCTIFTWHVLIRA